MIILSIVIPVYNVEKYLVRCVESILNLKTNIEYEIILVNDGSTDNSGKICDDLASNCNLIKVIHQFNRGLSEARNTGIKEAKGKYLYFIDSDDFLIGDIFTLFTKAYSKYEDFDILHFGYIKVYENTVLSINKNSNYDFEKYSQEETLKHYLLGDKVTRMAWDKIYKKELFIDIKYPEHMLVEDYGTTYKILGKIDFLIKCNEIIYGYYQRNNSIMGNRSLKLILHEYHFGCENYAYFKSKFPNLKYYNCSEHVNLLIKTYSRIRAHKDYAKQNENRELLKKIRKQSNLMIFCRTRLRSKIMQVLLLICPAFAVSLMKRKDERDWK